MRKLVLAGAILALVPTFAFAQSERVCQSTYFQGATYVQCSDGTTTIIVDSAPPVAAPAPTPTPEPSWSAGLTDWPQSP